MLSYYRTQERRKGQHPARVAPFCPAGAIFRSCYYYVLILIYLVMMCQVAESSNTKIGFGGRGR